ncbi:sialidase family protein [Plantactinospora sonchi]|uniref:Photosynthesis system II assembly factor Ycf48/Hcf136-like domain-containing protein n=1 Tax=Plantactinospora sonchi TaxID=1544735 RepID=A0ABU7RXU6_9ACTN
MPRYPFDAATVAETVVQPPLADLAERAGRRVRRRRAAVSVTALGVAMFMTLTAVPLVRTWWNLPSHSPAAGAGPLVASAVLARKTVVTVRYNQCAVQFSITRNSGDTWSSYRGPVRWRTCGTPTTTSYELLGPDLYVAVVQGVRYLTRDAGENWEKQAEKIADVAVLPLGAIPRGDQAGQFVDPVTGAIYRIGPPLPLLGFWSIRRAPDGVLWGWAPHGAPEAVHPTAQAAVVRSDDGGRSWLPTARLPVLDNNPILVPASGREAYLLGSRAGRSLLYRTDDGGQSWTSNDAPWADVVVGTVTYGGYLLLCEWRTEDRDFVLWRSNDGGRTFQQGEAISVSGTPDFGELDGLLWVAGEGRTATSVDGNWTVARPRQG